MLAGDVINPDGKDSITLADKDRDQPRPLAVLRRQRVRNREIEFAVPVEVSHHYRSGSRAGEVANSVGEGPVTAIDQDGNRVVVGVGDGQIWLAIVIEIGNCDSCGMRSSRI